MKQLNIKVLKSRLPVNEKGIISVEDVKASLRKDTILVSVMHVNNETWCIQPIEELAKMIHQNSRAVISCRCRSKFWEIS